MMSGTSMSGIIIILVCLLSTAISASIDKTSDPDGIWHNVHRRTLFGSAGESSVTGEICTLQKRHVPDLVNNA